MTSKPFKIVALLLMTVSVMFGQTQNLSPGYPNAQAGRVLASAYANYRVHSTNATAAGTATMILDNCFPTGIGSNNRLIFPFATNVPVIIVDGTNTENVTPSAVATPTVAGASTINPLNCSITASFSNPHSVGASIVSGDNGLAEAVNDAVALGSSLVAADFAAGVTTANITGMSNPSAQVIVEYLKPNGLPTYYEARPTAVTLIAAPSAPTVTLVSGSLSSGQYYATAAYVDCLGGISLDSTDSAQTATATGLVIASPAATAGACGWLPRITAAAGSTGTEILAKAVIDSTICTLSTTTWFPSCAIGANATVTAANPSSTAKPMVEANAFTTLGYQPINGDVMQFMNSYPFGVFVATSTLNSSNADGAQFQTPAGFFNFLGKSWDVCVKGGTATQVASSLLTVTLKASTAYAQSPVTISTLAFPTQTQAAAGTFEGCVRVTTSTTGSSGKFWVSSASGPWVDFLNSAPATQVATADASAAASSAIDLTKPLYWSVNLAAANANNITVPIVNSVSILPVQ